MKDNLKEKLIENGLKLLSTEGYQNFSMRKVSTLCNVSHNAPYKHFKNKEEIIGAIMDYAISDFKECLVSAIIKNPDNPKSQVKQIGINYIKFFVSRREYLDLFFNSDMKGQLTISKKGFNYGKAHLFGIFDNVIKKYIEAEPGNIHYDPIIVLEFWSTVHGLTTLISTKKIVFEDDFNEFLEKITDRMLNNLSKI